MGREELFVVKPGSGRWRLGVANCQFLTRRRSIDDVSISVADIIDMKGSRTRVLSSPSRAKLRSQQKQSISKRIATIF